MNKSNPNGLRRVRQISAEMKANRVANARHSVAELTRMKKHLEQLISSLPDGERKTALLKERSAVCRKMDSFVESAHR
jgi:hypothetical protein